MEYPTDGILLIDKDEGETSYSVVRKVKLSIAAKKVGHAGTLDPFATGLLIILIGQGTKLSNYIMSEDKVYFATLRLGVETDTLDSTGRVLRISSVPDLSPESIQEKTRGFVGNIEQTPPVYSAVKYKGTRAYKLARRGIKITLKKRKVIVYSLRILSVSLPDIIMEIVCSSGTYIRSLGADLGTELGPGGHLVTLRRLAGGFFNVKDALSSNEILDEGKRKQLQKKIIPLKNAIPGMREIDVQENMADKVRHGNQPKWKELGSNFAGNKNEYVKLVKGSELVAIVKTKKNGRGDNGKIKIERVFY
ncbi:MAG TPA: tRNA pseudouridine(55) synthase TruB [Desulfobacteraceae bacterium]|nr:tRNA pseudouridine(55) synthase TruB [Desulfobacteraceae bacterium]